MYELNKYGKIVVDSKEVYYGCVLKINQEISVAELLVKDWRDIDDEQRNFTKMIVPLSKFTIKYLEMRE